MCTMGSSRLRIRPISLSSTFRQKTFGGFVSTDEGVHGSPESTDLLGKSTRRRERQEDENDDRRVAAISYRVEAK